MKCDKKKILILVALFLAILILFLLFDTPYENDYCEQDSDCQIMSAYTGAFLNCCEFDTCLNKDSRSHTFVEFLLCHFSISTCGMGRVKSCTCVENKCNEHYASDAPVLYPITEENQ